MNDKPDQKDRKKRYAIVNSPNVEAVVNQLFRMGTERQALDRMDEIKKGYIISKDQELGAKSLKLWIKGYDVTPEEKEKGIIGNYAVIRIKKLDNSGKWTLYPEKIPAELKFHPQKRRPRQKHPDWGHPLLRLIKKQKKFDTLEQATGVLETLHEEYPDVSIPAMNKLFIMIYAKTEKKDEIPVKKYILLIRAEKEGGFFIDWQENTKKPAPPVVKPQDGVEGAAKPAPQGYFTSMVELRKKKKRKAPVRKTAGTSDTGEKPN